MQRLIWVGVAAAAVVSACTAAEIPTTAPGTRTPAATASPGLSASPTLAMPPLSTAVASPLAVATVANFGARTPIFEDQFGDPESGWGTGSTQGGQVQYLDGALAFNFATPTTWLWSTRPLGSAQSVVHVEAVFTPSASGYQGLLCADSDELMYGAVANAEGRWAFITLTDVRAELLTTEDHPAWTIAPGASTRVALDCAGTATGSFRMQLSLPDSGVGTIYDGGAAGPATFNRVGVYAEAASESFSVEIDDAQVYGDSG